MTQFLGPCQKTSGFLLSFLNLTLDTAPKEASLNFSRLHFLPASPAAFLNSARRRVSEQRSLAVYNRFLGAVKAARKVFDQLATHADDVLLVLLQTERLPRDESCAETEDCSYIAVGQQVARPGFSGGAAA